jgi:hypothetical protein
MEPDARAFSVGWPIRRNRLGYRPGALLSARFTTMTCGDAHFMDGLLGRRGAATVLFSADGEVNVHFSTGTG